MDIGVHLYRRREGQVVQVTFINNLTSVNFSTMTEPDPEPEMQPVDVMEECAHAVACRMQWEREHGKFNDELFFANKLAELLGCGEECGAFDTWHTKAERVIEGNGVVGRCTCSACLKSIGINDNYCKHCGSELS